MALLLGCSSAMAAGEPADPQAELQEVPLYTNADLARFALPEAEGGDADCEPGSREPLEGWAFVDRFLQRERARLAAEREYDLERARLEQERLAEEQPQRLVLPFFPLHAVHRHPLRFGHGPRGVVKAPRGHPAPGGQQGDRPRLMPPGVPPRPDPRPIPRAVPATARTRGR